MLYNKIQVLCSYILSLVCSCISHLFGIYGIFFNTWDLYPNIQSAQIEFSALNTINVLHEICTSCHNNTCNTWEDCSYYFLLFHIYIYNSYSLIKL